jgi:hypothetical protein
MLDSDKIKMKTIQKKLSEVTLLYDQLSDDVKKDIQSLQCRTSREKPLLEYLIKWSSITMSAITEVMKIQ